MLAIAISIFLGVTAILVAWVLGQSAAQAIHGYSSICRELEEIGERSRAALASRGGRPEITSEPRYLPMALRSQPLGAGA